MHPILETTSGGKPHVTTSPLKRTSSSNIIILKARHHLSDVQSLALLGAQKASTISASLTERSRIRKAGRTHTEKRSRQATQAEAYSWNRGVNGVSGQEIGVAESEASLFFGEEQRRSLAGFGWTRLFNAVSDSAAPVLHEKRVSKSWTNAGTNCLSRRSSVCFPLSLDLLISTRCL